MRHGGVPHFGQQVEAVPAEQRDEVERALLTSAERVQRGPQGRHVTKQLLLAPLDAGDETAFESIHAVLKGLHRTLYCSTEAKRFGLGRERIRQCPDRRSEVLERSARPLAQRVPRNPSLECVGPLERVGLDIEPLEQTRDVWLDQCTRPSRQGERPGNAERVGDSTHLAEVRKLARPAEVRDGGKNGLLHENNGK